MERLPNTVTRDVTIAHFLLMFGYKLFSAYFPLFLVARGFSLPQVGWSYLLLYLPIALGAPLAGFLSRKTNPALLMILGIIGYAAYALGMIFIQNPLLFYFWQVMLGVAAALFFTAARILLMTYPMANIEHSFSWFYNAPSWANIVAPIVGGFLIWRGGFDAVFALSVIITLMSLAVVIARLRAISLKINNRGISAKKYLANWGNVLHKINSPKIAPYLAISLAVIWAGGVSGTFFILFLKDTLGWGRDAAIAYTASSSALFSIIYILLIRPRQKNTSEKSIIAGGAAANVFLMGFALPLPLLNLFSIFALDFTGGVGSFICNVGRSSLLTRELKNIPEEAGALDTIFSPLGTALGALCASLLISSLGYQQLFLYSSLIATTVVAIATLSRPIDRFK